MSRAFSGRSSAISGALARQAILARDAPPQLVAVIDEVVLRRRVGDRAVMAGQLAHLLAVAAQEHVQVRLIRLPDGAETAYVDNQLRGQVVTESADIASLGARWESVAGEALPRGRSIELIREVATAWT
ncbi:DUF5753 domain-containing protein [Micromonospora echinofusca]|uniref:DUF5753 domain-containing protein n=1 Tax=Micromonospora echinofusca TaxID=47858 RepID=UPI00344265EA